MKLYHNPQGPKAQPFYGADAAPASAYALQQHLLAAYREVLYGWWGYDDIILACFGPRTGKKLAAAEERLDYDIPELIERMDAQELHTAAEVFCAGTLPGFVWHVITAERHLIQREDELGRDRVDDKGHCKAAGLGKGKRPQRVVKITPPRKPQPTEHVAPKPILRTQRRRARYNPHHERQLVLWP